MSQRVQYGDANAVVVLHAPSDEVRADETGASCDYYVSHALFNRTAGNLLLLIEICRLEYTWGKGSKNGTEIPLSVLRIISAAASFVISAAASTMTVCDRDLMLCPASGWAQLVICQLQVQSDSRPSLLSTRMD